LRAMATRKASGLQLEVDSAGTADYHVGSAPDLRSQRAALARGIDISGLRALHATVRRIITCGQRWPSPLRVRFLRCRLPGLPGRLPRLASTRVSPGESPCASVRLASVPASPCARDSILPSTVALVLLDQRLAIDPCLPSQTDLAVLAACIAGEGVWAADTAIVDCLLCGVCGGCVYRVEIFLRRPCGV
jgi:hypothetical protein